MKNKIQALFIFLKDLRRLPAHLFLLAAAIAGMPSKLAAITRGMSGNKSRESVLIIMIEHIGDIIACGPLIAEIRRRHPAAYLTWAVRKEFEDLVVDNENIDSIFRVNCLTDAFLLKRTGKFSKVYDLHPWWRTCEKCMAQYIVRPDKKRDSHAINDLNYFEKFSLLGLYSDSAGIDCGDAAPALNIPAGVRNGVDKLGLPEKFIVAHCVSNNPQKDWPRDSWRRLADEVFERFKLPIVEVGSEAAIASRSGLYHDLCGKTSLLETAEVINRASLFIGIDSGPAHMANALSKPGVVMLGSYLGFKNYNPFSGGYGRFPDRVILRRPDIKDISPQDALRTIGNISGSPLKL